jgi:hypothetical protein
VKRPISKLATAFAAFLFAALPALGRLCELKCAAGPPAPAAHCEEHAGGGSPPPGPCAAPHGQNPILLSARPTLAISAPATFSLPAATGAALQAAPAYIAAGKGASFSTRPPPLWPILRL